MSLVKVDLEIMMTILRIYFPDYTLAQKQRIS